MLQRTIALQQFGEAPATRQDARRWNSLGRFT